MRNVAVIGVGETKFSGPQEKTAIEMFAEAAAEAIQESNLKPKDVEALFVGNALGDFAEGQGMIQAYAAEYIGCRYVPANRYEGACASASVAVRDAYMWVASGMYDIVLAGGVERAATMGTALATRTFAMFGDAHYEYPAGATFPAVFGMLAHLYADTYKVPLEQLREYMARVSMQSYKHGSINPKAQFFGKNGDISMEKVLGSFVVTSPLTLHDCCPFSDGAAAIIVASEEAAKKLTDKPVFFRGVGQASNGPLVSQFEYMPRIRAREISSEHAYKMAGITPQDVDFCELHDCFSIASLIATESLGFFDYGTSGEAWEKGEADIGGKIAVNPSGGLKAKGHPIGATGAGQVYEVARQLRGQVEPGRQVPDARIGMTDTLGGDGGTLVNMIFEKGW